MAVANCGQHWSWDSPMWCSGIQENNINGNHVKLMCNSCAWYKGNNKTSILDYEEGRKRTTD